MEGEEAGKMEEAEGFIEDLQELCENVDEISNSTNSTDDVFSDFDVANAISSMNSIFDLQTGTNPLVEEANNAIPNFSENDTIPVFCSKVAQADYVFKTNQFCPSVGTFKYKPAKCDPGYFCGCADPEGQRCQPSNDTSSTLWAGYYTELEIDPATNRSTGKEIVYTGLANEFPPEYFKCNNTLYCPGKLGASLTVCPKLCEEGHYCPDPTEQLVCPVGSYCMRGSIEPKECSGLERCKSEGMDLPHGELYLVTVIIITLVAFGCVLVTYRYLNTLYPFHKNAGKEEVANLVDTTITSASTSFRLVKHSVAAEGQERKFLRQASNITTPKPLYTIDVKFNNLQRTLPNGICIMQDVTGELKGGQFTAIMGPSGAGKSTFLSLLSGKIEPTGGTLSVNGKLSSLKDFRELVGFVPQEDIMLRELTVEENIRHSAWMRLSTGLSHQQKMDRVHKVMESLDLLHIRNSIIGDELIRGISGGQRKRVNVAMELVANPSLLALDEPTSGLDSTTSSKLCETLSQLALTGVNVAAVIHQPKIEILEKFSNVLLLGVGGKTVFMGPAKDMTYYFTRIGFPLPAQMNPADYYMDVIAGLIPCDNNPNFEKEDLFDLWNNSPDNPGSDSERVNDDDNNTNTITENMKQKALNSFDALKGAQEKHRTTPGFLGQTYLLFKRAVLQRCRVPRNTLIPLILSAFAAILIGYYTRTVPLLYYGLPKVAYYTHFKASYEFMHYEPIPPSSQIPSIWLFTALTIMLVCIVSINTFGLEKAVFLRESFSGTNPTSYWLSRTLESGMWLPLYSAIYVTVQFIFQPLTITVVQYWIVTWMSMIGFSGIGHIVSLTVGQSNRGIVHLITCLVLIMVFSGFMLKYDGNKFFSLFFTYWTAQGYVKGCTVAYEDVFDVDLFNSVSDKYNLEYVFGFDMICAFLTGVAWHLIVLIIIIYRAR